MQPDQEKQARLKQIAHIQGMNDNTKRWRAILDFALRVNPNIRAEHKLHLKAIREDREAQANQFGAAKKSGMRYALSMPETIWHLLNMFDPYIKEATSEKSAAKQNKVVRELAKAFPEYKIYKVI